MLRILFGAIAGAALMVGLLGLPPPLMKIWDDIQKANKTQQNEEKALQIVHEFETSYRPSTDCVTPRNELKRLECANRRDMAFQSYVRQRVKQN